MSITKEVLSEIKPKQVDTKVVNEVVDKINNALKINKIKAKCVIGGSFAKDTFLRDDYDVDLFVRFDYKEFLDADKNNQLSGILDGMLNHLFPNVERVHGSRDYFQLKKGKFDFEIVPVLKIIDPKKAMNVTDMSPLHVAWVKKHKKGDQIRLSKAFCKAAKVYGAESYIKGFSGHVLDILTTHYGDFEKFLKAVTKWDKEKIIIDIDNYYKGKALQKLNKSKTHSPLIVIDPVQPERNAAAALGKEKFDLLISAAKKYQRKKSKSFFTKTALTKSSLKVGKNKLIFLNAKALEGKEDVVGAKILKVFTHIKKYLMINEFTIKYSGWEFDKNSRKALLYFVIDPKTLPLKIAKMGPPINQKKHCEDFIKKNLNVFKKDERLFAELKRPYRTALPLVKDLIADKYIREKVAGIKIE